MKYFIFLPLFKSVRIQIHKYPDIQIYKTNLTCCFVCVYSLSCCFKQNI